MLIISTRFFKSNVKDYLTLPRMGEVEGPRTMALN